MTSDKDAARVKVRVYRVPARSAARILLNYDGAVRPLLWLYVGTDGSVYLGLSRPAGSVEYSGGEAHSAGEASLRYSDVNEISDPEFCKRIHLSFHSSGVINVSGMRWQRVSWKKSLTVCQQLCLFVFEHPSHFPRPMEAGSEILYSNTPCMKIDP